MYHTQELSLEQFVVLYSYLAYQPFDREVQNRVSDFWRKISNSLSETCFKGESFSLSISSHEGNEFIFNTKGLKIIAEKQPKKDPNSILEIDTETIFSIVVYDGINDESEKFIEIALANLPYVHSSRYLKDYDPIEIAICNIMFGNTRLERVKKTFEDLENGIGRS
jgi:hypothetical protein